jgi:hypothetical protein
VKNTKIGNWQMETEISKPNIKLKKYIDSVMVKHIIDNTKWVDTSDSIDIEYWKRYRSNLIQNGTDWENLLYEEYISLWKYMSSGIYKVYDLIYKSYSTVVDSSSYEILLNKESLEQAVEWVSSIDPNIDEYPLIKLYSEFNKVSPDNICNNIINNESISIAIITKLEYIKLSFVESILICKKTLDVDNAITVIEADILKVCNSGY